MTTERVAPELSKLAADTIRMLAVDGVEKARSGHPGMPMGAADYASVLWTRYLRFNPQDPGWPNRDRFVLSAGHGSMLLYALLHLSGYDLPMEELKRFRQWGSMTPGHPEYGCAPGVETTTGPLGQGFANGVGMGIAAQMIGARFNTEDFPVIDHYIYAIVGDGDLMEGVSAEAASLAGHLKLGNLIYIYDDNHITIDGDTNLTYSEDVAARFAAYGWFVQKIDGHDHEAIAEAIEKAQAEISRPSLIMARTHIAYGSPNKQDTAGAHGAPLGPDEVIATKKNLGWPLEPTFFVPQEVRELFAARVADLKRQYGQWQKGFEEWGRAHPELLRAWQAQMGKFVPDDVAERLLEAVPEADSATRRVSGQVIQVAADLVPSLCGGSADLSPSNHTVIKSSTSVGPGDFRGRNLHFGIREHAMGAIANGMALYGGLIPYVGTFLVFSDYMRPPIRLAAMMHQQVIYVFTHDSFFLGEDGPTHQPVEQLSALRAIPGLTVFRPADALETVMAWSWALSHANGPTALILTRQSVPVLDRGRDFDPRLVWKGGYIVSDVGDGTPDVTIMATGSEVSLAVEASGILAERGYSARVVSLPSLELFEQQPSSYRDEILPPGCHKLVAVEAGRTRCWRSLTGRDGLIIGMDHFGASAPQRALAERFGFTPQQVADRILSWL